MVLVDAMCTGGAPGTCVTLEGRAIERYSAGSSISHTIGIAELMDLAHRLSPEPVPATLHFVGVEGARFTEYGDKLSPEVEAAIPKGMAAVLGVIGADTDLLASATSLSLK